VLGGHDVVREPLAARRISSVVFQDPVVDRSFTGRRNLELHGRLWGVGVARTAEQIGRVSETLGIAHLLDRPVAGYSGGERRRLEIARALISSPRVLFLDEPTVGLDPRIRHELLDAVDALRRREELTVLLTTHYLDEAERLCDRIAVMHAGRIVALGSPQELRARLGRELLELQVARDAEAALDVLQSRGVADEDAFAVGATVIVPLRSAAPEAIAAARETGLAITAVATRPPTLDDVYLRLTGGRLAA
jgi:ABC-2 type transport system ATP-binding protein